jgi:hypothetical protein
MNEGDQDLGDARERYFVSVEKYMARATTLALGAQKMRGDVDSVAADLQSLRTFLRDVIQDIVEVGDVPLAIRLISNCTKLLDIARISSIAGEGFETANLTTAFAWSAMAQNAKRTEPAHNARRDKSVTIDQIIFRLARAYRDRPGNSKHKSAEATAKAIWKDVDVELKSNGKKPLGTGKSKKNQHSAVAKRLRKLDEKSDE